MNAARQITSSLAGTVRRLGDSDVDTGVAVLHEDGLVNERGLTLVLELAGDLAHRDPEVAHRLVLACDRAAKDAGLIGIRARACYQLAQILAERDELTAAMKLITKARHLWLEDGNALGALRTNVGLMQVLDDLGQHEAAVRVGDELITALETLPPDSDRLLVDQIRAHATENLGVAHGFIGQHDLALENYHRAEQAYLRLGMYAESARSRANRGVELMALGRLREALSDLLHAEEMFRASGDVLFSAQCRGEAAKVHRQLGEFAKALELLEQARHSLDQLGATVEADRLQLNLAETYVDASLWVEAKAAANAAADSAVRAGRARDAAMGHYLAALSDLALGRPETAMHSVVEAETLFTQAGDRQYSARARLVRAEALMSNGETKQARTLLGECIGELRHGGWVIPLVCAYLHQTEVADNPESAQEFLTLAAPLVNEIGMPELTYQYQLRAGRLCLESGRRDEAERHFRRAIAALGKVTRNLPDYVLRTAFRSDRFAAHDQLVNLLVERGHPADVLEACRIADATKVQTLTELRARSRFGPDRPTDDELTTASRELASTYVELHTEDLPGAREELARRAARLEHQVTTRRLLQPHPNLPGDADADREVTTSDTTRATGRLSPVLAFHAIDNDILVFVTVNAETTVHRLPGALARVHTLMDALEDQRSRFALGFSLFLKNHEHLLSAALEVLASLHTLLIAPVQHLFDNTHDQLFIVPHARMGPVPFHALFDGQHYMLQKWEITVSPTSVTHPAMSMSLSFPTPTVVVAVPDSFAPGVSQEAAAIAELHPHAVVLVDDQASTAAFRAASSEAGLIHLACHGVHRASNPLFSRLRFIDRWMTSAEILDLDFTGALVILSACETGAHDRVVEPIGLGWAFLAAGAAGVMVSMWEAHDEATRALMTELHRLLTAGSPPARALRLAQLHTAERYPHPFYWAAFSYVTSPLTTRSTQRDPN